MGSLAVFSPIISTDPWLSSPNFLQISSSRVRSSSNFNSRKHQQRHKLNCSYHNRNTSSSSSSRDDDHQPHQDALLKVILGISKAEGRIGRTTTMVLGGTVADESPYEGISMNKMVNIYPTARGFTAIGSGGDDFVQSMVVAVESVVQHPIPQGKVKQKLSSGGKYVSVNIGPVQIVSSKQVQAVYYAMKRDDRMRYFL
ncbi:hypothetical protein CTI12_AA409490 [Artemisia annua]|uniref:Uncharacterized protein n=1 Tax=Artemisia annua TaxID=35608 RepID=A0A2U1M8C0_ARTAN|nr:hypothetical protein CTI12_AA409490 [Artemisia annua]